MKLMRRFAVLAALAFALAMGQQGGLLHGLAHAGERMSQKQDGKTAPAPCELCALAAQLDGPPSAAFAAAHVAGALPQAPAFVSQAAPAATRTVFLSRAPPVIS
jgi:hypothetical protein